MKSLRQNLYLLNFLLAAEFFLVFFFVLIIKKNATVKPVLVRTKIEPSKQFKPLTAGRVPLGQAYGKRDIFGLGQNLNVVEQEKDVPALNIPQLVIPEISKAPVAPVVDFIDPLTITLNGIIGSSIPERSVCILADETDKEKTYKVGDRIKDGVIIKILRDRVIILRLNGQVETHCLSEINPLQQSVDVMSLALKVSENKYKIDPIKFRQKIVNLGSLLDYFEMAPFVGSDGSVIGIVVMDKNPKGLAAVLGFNENDLILSIDEIPLTSSKNRMKIYDQIVNKKENAEFPVEFERGGRRLKNTYFISSKVVKPEAPTTLTPEVNKENVLQTSPSKSFAMFPELMSQEERKSSDAMSQENLGRIRQEMFRNNLQTRTN